MVLKRRSFVMLLLILFFITSLSTVSFAEGTNTHQQQKLNVMEVFNFTEEFIDSMPHHEFLFYVNHVNDVRNLSYEVKYYRFDYDISDPLKPKNLGVMEVSKQEAELYSSISEWNNFLISTSCGSIAGYDCIKSSWLELETWVYQENSTTGRAMMRWEWLKSPNYRLKDVMAIGFNSNMSPKPGTEYGYYLAEKILHDNTRENILTEYQTADKRDTGGYAYIVNLLNGTVAKHSGYMRVDFTPNVSTLIKMDAFSHYAHQEKIFGITPGISYPSGGSLTLTYQNDFDILTGHTQANWF